MSQTSVGNLSVELGISDDQLRAGLAAAVVQAQQAGQKMQAAMNGAARPSMLTGGMGGLGGFAQTIGRIADDAQYGFRGIVNNLEQLGQSAGSVFGLTTKDAMAFGAVMTLLGVAVNQASDELVKLTDNRTEFEKLATSAMSYAGSLNAAQAALKALSAETSDLIKKDATTGFGGFIGRITQKMMDNASQGKNPLSDVFNGDVTKAQLQANKDAGRQALRNQLDLLDMAPQAQRSEDALKAGSELLDKDRNAKSVETSKDMAATFAEAIKGNAEKVYGDLQKQLVATGTQPNQAEVDARVMMGNAAKGVISSFEDLSKRLPELKLDEKLKGLNSFKETEENMQRLGATFRDRQKLEEKTETAQDRIDKIMGMRARSEVLNSAADVFNRNISAGTEDPQLKELQGLREDIKKYTDEIKGLG